MVVEIKELACELPATTGVPLARWSCSELARELVARAVVTAISAATVWRVLRRDAIRPWFHRSWIFPRDPDFAAKAAVALDLYARVFEGQPLGDDEFVICADEKTSIQARCRCHPTLPPGRARMMRVEHEYKRGGALAYLAAYDVHRARVMGRCENTTGIVPFGRLLEQVMTAEPYASARRVFWIVDNGSSHRRQRCIARLQGQWPTLRLIHLPVHASWLDQCEIYFSIVQRKVVNPNDFTDLDQIQERLAAFERRYNAVAEPFDWTFGRDDLDKLLARLDAHASRAASAPPAHCLPSAAVPIPDGARRALTRRLDLQRQQRWPDLDDINIRYRAAFAYIDGITADGDTLRLCRLRYLGSPDNWGFAIYLASKDGYEDSILPRGSFTGTPEEALDCACGLYLNDISAWTEARPNGQPSSRENF